MEENQMIGLDKDADKAAGPVDTLAERKQRLLRQAEFYRVGIVHSRAGIRQATRPEALFHSALDHATWAVRTRVDALLRPTGIQVASVMPYALTVFGFLRRRGLIKPALGIAAVLGGAAYYLQHRRAKAAY